MDVYDVEVVLMIPSEILLVLAGFFSGLLFALMIALYLVLKDRYT